MKSCTWCSRPWTLKLKNNNPMKKITFLLAIILCMSPSLFAQGTRPYEMGAKASFRIAIGRERANNYNIDLFGGYKFNKHVSAGAGIQYVTYGGAVLPGGIERVYVATNDYRGFRPYVYGRYDVLPSHKWTPFVAARLGYGIFAKSKLTYGVVFGYDDSDKEDFEYLKDLDHTLGVRGNVFASIDVGYSLHVGKQGSKFSFGFSLDMQPVQFEYNHHKEKRTRFSFGPTVGFTF